MSSDVSDDDKNEYTEEPKLSKRDIFKKIADMGGFLKEHGDLETQETGFPYLRGVFGINC